MNKRTEIIDKKPYDPEKSQYQSDNIVIIGHCNFELADCLKNKGIPGYRQYAYIINVKHYTIYP